MTIKTDKSSIITSLNLGAYFFSELETINSKQNTPLRTEVLIYCAELLKDFSHSHKLYEENAHGKYQEKILGLSLLNASHLDQKNKYKKIKEIGDTSLILCGYFVESIDRKILGIDYYKKVGVFSFLELDKIAPDYLNVQSFYKQVASGYDLIINIFQLLRASLSPQDKKDILLFLAPANKTGS